MTQTRASKLRKKLGREGRFDITRNRGGQQLDISVTTRRTKTKKEKMESEQNKHKKRTWV